MRLRGLEPPPGCPDTDLNRARLPIPPQPRAVRKRRYRTALGRARRLRETQRVGVRGDRVGRSRRGQFASLDRSIRAAIVQGTRTPASHAGNRGSNPRSGTSVAGGRSLMPLTATRSNHGQRFLLLAARSGRPTVLRPPIANGCAAVGLSMPQAGCHPLNQAHSGRTGCYEAQAGEGGRRRGGLRGGRA
jgi:hypothetical protein